MFYLQSVLVYDSYMFKPSIVTFRYLPLYTKCMVCHFTHFYLINIFLISMTRHRKIQFTTWHNVYATIISEMNLRPLELWVSLCHMYSNIAFGRSVTETYSWINSTYRLFHDIIVIFGTVCIYLARTGMALFC